MSAAAEVVAVVEKACCGPEAIAIAEEVVAALARAVGLQQVAALVEKIATALTDPTTQDAATRAAYAATDAALDAAEGEKLAEIAAETKTP